MIADNTMKDNVLKYNLINILVLAASVIIFIKECLTKGIISEFSFGRILIVFMAVVVVHAVKAGRLYFALSGEGLTLSTYLKTYCKVTPVSLLFPFKTGEFFRIYCYGNEMDGIIKGAVTVLMDRFMDTGALVTMIVIIGGLHGGKMTLLVYLLLLFLFFAVFVYYVFPGVFQYQKKYILRTKATPRKIYFLKILENLNVLYQEVSKVSKGRGIILYLMSVLAWSAEIGSIAALNRIYGGASLDDKVMEYLSAVLGGEQPVELKQFIIISVAFMITIYVIVKVFERAGRKRGRDANNCCV